MQGEDRTGLRMVSFKKRVRVCHEKENLPVWETERWTAAETTHASTCRYFSLSLLAGRLHPPRLPGDEADTVPETQR